MKDEKDDKKHTFDEAVKIVNAAIREKEEYYKKVSKTDEQPPIMLEGRTEKGYSCQLMVDPKDVAKIFLDYGYATCCVLGEEAPMDMWDALAEYYGLDAVEGVDL